MSIVRLNVQLTGFNLDAKLIGSRIKKVRGKLTQSEFASYIEVPKNTLGRYERGETVPDMGFAMRICTTFGVNASWFLTGDGEAHAETVEEKQGKPCVADPIAACFRCERLEEDLRRERDEVRELTAENRSLWKENGELKAENAVLKEKIRADPDSAGATRRSA